MLDARDLGACATACAACSSSPASIRPRRAVGHVVAPGSRSIDDPLRRRDRRLGDGHRGDAQHASCSCRMGDPSAPIGARSSIRSAACSACDRPARDRRLGHAGGRAREHAPHHGDDRRKNGRHAPALTGAVLKGGSDGKGTHGRTHAARFRARRGLAGQAGARGDPRARAADRRSAPPSLGAPQQRYLFHELLADTGSGHNIVATVFVDCHSMYRTDGPAEMSPSARPEFANGVAAMSASGIYGPSCAPAPASCHVDLRLGARAAVFEAQIAAGNGRFHGIRHDRRSGPAPTCASAPRTNPPPR